MGQVDNNHIDKYCDVKPAYCSCNKSLCPHSKVNVDTPVVIRETRESKKKKK